MKFIRFWRIPVKNYFMFFFIKKWKFVNLAFFGKLNKLFSQSLS